MTVVSMKKDIEVLVREILHVLLSPPPTPEEVTTIMIAMGVDGPSRAVQLRDVVRARAEDESLPEEVRECARLHLAELPAF
jgi:hypothetical protein